MVGNGERESRDDDVAERFARDIHALPEAVGAEQNGLGVFFEFFQKEMARRWVSLGKERRASLIEKRTKLGGEMLQGAMTGEEDEGFSVRHFDKVFDPAGQSGFVGLGIRRFGHLLRNVDFHLFWIIERRSELEGASFESADSLLKITETFSDGERGTGEDGGMVGTKEHFL